MSGICQDMIFISWSYCLAQLDSTRINWLTMVIQDRDEIFILKEFGSYCLVEQRGGKLVCHMI